jgi:hypothetical protein
MLKVKLGSTKKATINTNITIASIKTKNLVEEKSNAITKMFTKNTINQTYPNTTFSAIKS